MASTATKTTLSDLMLKNGIRSIVYVPASDLLPRGEFHAWRFDNFLECGTGGTAEEAVADAAKLDRKAA